jgi:Leucine-rich repeat (LRR) protein
MAMLMALYCSLGAQCEPLEEAIEKPKEVRALDLTGCNLRAFPEEILKMKNLEALYLGPRRMIMYRANAGSPVRGNLFKKLPEGFGKLKHLKVLDLQATDLRSLPPSFEKLKALKALDLSFNPRLDTTVLFDILPRLDSLQQLNLTGSNLNSSSCQRLEESLPNTRCIFDKTKIISRIK